TTARIRMAGTRLEQLGPVLITHWGLSGPAVLKMSSIGAREMFKMNYRSRLLINWAPAFHEQSLKDAFTHFRSATPARRVAGRNSIDIPQRLWALLCRLSDIDGSLRWVELP